MPTSAPHTNASARIAAVYLVLGTVWIIGTDWVLARWFPEHLSTGQMVKGVLFVVLGAALIYVLVDRELAERRALEADREKLRQRLAGAERLEAIGRLTGGIAHDFNNLLTAILGNLDAYIEDLTASGRSREEMTELLEAASAARRAAELTGQLLAFGRRQRLQPRTLDLNVVIADMTQLLRRLIGDRIDVKTELCEAAWAVRVDQGPLQQVVMNLALNARDAMADGGTLTLSTRNVSLTERSARADFDFPIEPGSYVVLEVGDTGVGMDEETLERIYEPFFTTKAKDVGTGLGLATVFGVVKQSGGYIDVASEVGQGTRFRIYFPKSDGPVEDTAPRPEVTPEPNSESGSVLVVEDDAAVRTLISRTLRREGYTVHAVADGHGALAVLRNGARIDLVLTDAVVPGPSGGQVIREARRMDPDIRVLMISGHAMEDVGVDEPYLAKPFTPSGLITRVRELMPPGPTAR